MPPGRNRGSIQPEPRGEASGLTHNEGQAKGEVGRHGAEEIHGYDNDNEHYSATPQSCDWWRAAIPQGYYFRFRAGVTARAGSGGPPGDQ